MSIWRQMSVRRQRKSNNENSSVQERIEKLLDSSLNELAVKLKWLTSFEHEQIIEYVSKLLERVPENLDRHFYFDAWMIQSIVQSWSNNLSWNSRMVIPSCYDVWGYERIPIPSSSTDSSSLAVSFIYIPSEMNERPSLLDYPWLCHELGHHLLSLPKHQQMLFDKFHPHLEVLLSRLKRMSLSDHGLARTQSQAVISELDAKWKSSEWVEELAIDVITLWVCGPAYLAAFEDAHEDTGDPFVIEQKHPPVELRTYALLHAARELGWDQYLEGLEQIQDGWHRRIPSSIGNHYRSLRNPELVTQCVATALTYCKSVKIPCLTLDDLNKIRMNWRRKNDFSNGVEVIVAAWVVYHENEERYDDWENHTFNKLTDEILQESVK